MTGSAASYEAGDHVGIYVENEPDIVDKVCRLLQHSPDTILQFKHPPGNPDRLAQCPAGQSSDADLKSCIHDLQTV